MIEQKMPQDAVIDIVKVEHLPPYSLHLWFSDGAEQVVDFEPFLRHATHPDIRKYLDSQLFKQFKLVHGRLDWNDYELCFPMQDLYEGTLLKSSISKARSYEEMAEFWDTHSVADYEEQIEEVEMTFEPSARRAMVGVEPDLYKELCEFAKQRKISTQTLINVWLSQRVEHIKAATSHNHQYETESMNFSNVAEHHATD